MQIRNSALGLEPSFSDFAGSPDIGATKTISSELYQRLLRASVDVYKQKDTIQKLKDLNSDKDLTIQRLKNEVSTLKRKVINMDHLSAVCNLL